MDPQPHIAVVEDDPDFRDAVAAYLAGRGFRVTALADGRALDATLAAGLDAAVLDLNLPGESGLQIATRLRAAPSRPAILMLTGDGGLADRVVGLEMAADDYIAKPVELRELLARLRAQLRRRGETLAVPEAPRDAAPEGPHAGLAGRLRRAALRASLSRGRIAQAVQADKSAVSRWFSGAARPQETSLVALTGLIAARLPGFTLAVWDAPEAEFARAIGEAEPAAPPADGLPARLAGLWLGFFSQGGRGPWVTLLLELAKGTGAARVGSSVDWEAEGEAQLSGPQLWVSLRQTRPRPGLGLFGVWAGGGATALLDGLALVRVASASEAPVASRLVLFRLGNAPGPAFAGFEAALVRLRERPLDAWHGMAAAVLAGLDADDAAMTGRLAVPSERSVAVDEGSLAVIEPPDGPRRAALITLREAFGDLIGR
ncbi:response regulator transcription factor [Falsiroseomonas sp. HW251]|uniref:response regulator transcription factor n=1 Tax=Falsiroseomonas sp. HW251 TaxID=3390998 RepID=UPI003D3213B9